MSSRPPDAASERSFVVYVEPERVKRLLYALEWITQTEPHKRGCDQPDDIYCARCVAEAALAADEENYGG